MTDIILSLTRTTRVGYLRDIRRLTVALSRARLGLYILGRREVFEACYELRPAFELLLQRPDKLVLSTGEMWPSTRVLAEPENTTAEAAVPSGNEEAVMEGVEHLGQFVFEMTGVKARQLRAERGLLEGEGEGEESASLDPVPEADGDEPDYVVADEDEDDEGEEEGDGDGDGDEDIGDADADVEVGDVPKEGEGEGEGEAEAGAGAAGPSDQEAN